MTAKLSPPKQRQQQVSFFLPGQLSAPERTEDISAVYDLFKSDDQVKKVTEYIQQKHEDGIRNDFPEGKTDYQNDKKRLLSSVCFAGNVDRSKNATNDTFIHSGLITLDIDENTPDELAAFMQQVRTGTGTSKNNYIEAAALSISGFVNGSLWVNVRIEVPERLDRLDRELTKLLDIHKADSHFVKVSKLHEGYFRALSYSFKKQAGIVVPGSSKDVKRIRYIAHDSDLYVNQEVKTFSLASLKVVLNELKVQAAKAKRQLNTWSSQSFDIDTTDAFDYAEQFAQKKYSYETRQKYVNQLAIGLNLLGVTREDAERYVSQKYPDYDFSERTGRDGIRYPYENYTDNFGLWSYKLKPKDAAADHTFTLKKGEYLSEHAKELADMIHEDKKIDLKSGTGTGKNYATVKELAPRLKKLNGCKTVVVCSLNAKTEKDATQYAQYGVKFLTGDRLRKSSYKKEAIKKRVLDADIILCNQDTFPMIAADFTKKGEKVNVVIDESHTLITNMSFRGDTILRLMNAVDQVSETITLMSGTPKPYFQKLGFKRVQVDQEERPTINVHIRTRKKSIELTALKHCQMTDFDKVRVVIKIQCKKTIKRTKALLVKHGFSPDEVLCLYSDKTIKNSKAYKRFLKADEDSNSFADQVKVVLTTSVINEGLDIYADYVIDTVNIERKKSFNTVDLVQFADRHRTHNSKVLYSYHPHDDDQYADSTEIKYNALAEFDVLVKYWQSTADMLNAAHDSTKLTDTAIFGLRHEFSHHDRFLTWNEEKRRLEVNRLALMAAVDEEKTRRTKTTAGFAEIKNKYPYFDIVDGRAEQEEATPAEQEELADLKKIQAEKRLQAHEQLEQLYRSDRGVLFQAIGTVTDDTAIKNRVDFVESRKDAVRGLISSLPEVFSDFLPDAERLVKNHYKLKDVAMLADDDLQTMLFDQDKDTGRTKLTSARKLSVFYNGFKMHLALYLFMLSVDVKREYKKQLKALTITQAHDSKCIAAVVDAIDAIADRYEGRLTPAQIHKVVVATIGRKKTAGWSQKKSVELINVLFDTHRITDKDVHYLIGDRVHLTAFLERFSVDAQNVHENLCNRLNFNDLIRQTC